MTIGMGAASLAALVTAFSLMRSNTLLIDRDSGTLVSSRARFVWKRVRTCPLAEVRFVLLGTRIITHATPRNGPGGWSETVYRIMLDLGPTRMPVHEGIIGPSGRTLAAHLAKDLGVPLRNEF